VYIDRVARGRTYHLAVVRFVDGAGSYAAGQVQLPAGQPLAQHLLECCNHGQELLLVASHLEAPDAQDDIALVPRRVGVHVNRRIEHLAILAPVAPRPLSAEVRDRTQQVIAVQVAERWIVAQSLQAQAPLL
jgi:hypothetical protein